LKTKQYGKSSASLIRQKASFFKENAQHIKSQRTISDIYIKQPLRLNCKNCNSPLEADYDFIKDNIQYKICKVCTHLNGAHEDTNDFCSIVYTEDKGKSYAQNYRVEDVESFNYRLSSIYLPKAEFLYTSLVDNNESPYEMTYLDFGAGSGYFVGALRKMGLENVRGTEVSKYQVDFANRMLEADCLSIHDLDGTGAYLQQVDADVISLIGVLEHLQNPRDAISCIRGNNSVKYVYISVPLFSLSVFIEMMSDDVYHRHLHGGHTHLYTQDSLQYLADEFEFEIISEWWFGTDIVDLYRHIFVNMEESQCSHRMVEKLQNMVVPLIDSMQLELDKASASSEVHLLLKKKEK